MTGRKAGLQVIEHSILYFFEFIANGSGSFRFCLTI